MANQENKKKIESNQKYIPPGYKKTAFHCPHCEVFANQNWYTVCKYNFDFFRVEIRDYLKRTDFRADWLLSFLEDLYINLAIRNNNVSLCVHCKNYSIWVNGQMVYPNMPTAPLPIEEMPETVKKLYNEAREIAGKSPRGACALLRLAVQQLVKELGEDEKNLNKAIGNLVKKGLPEKIKKALDSVRVIGNNVVHPGKINIEDKPEITNTLFMLINFISEKMFRDDQTVEKIF